MTVSTEQVAEIQRKMAALPPERREALRLVLKKRGVDLSRDLILPRSDPAANAPLAYGQEQLWFLDRLSPGNSTYNMPALIDLSGPLDPEALERSLQAVVDRHEVLRTTFAVEEGRPVQVTAPRLEVHLRRADLRGLPRGRRETLAQLLAEREVLRPFDLSKGPLVRAMLVRVGEEEHVLALTVHHIVADGWSNGVLVRELTELYAAHRQDRDPDLSQLGIQFADFATWQRGWLRGDVLEQLLGYWRETLADRPATTLFPTDNPRWERERFRGTYQRTSLPPEAKDRLEALARSHEATLFMILLAALNGLLYRYTGEKDLVVGTSVANRQHVGTEPLLGFFVNTLLMRTRFRGDPSFEELLRLARDVSLGAFEHQDLPFELLVQELQPERDLAQASPLVQTVFVHLNLPGREVSRGDLTMAPRPPVTTTTKFDLVLTTSTDGGCLHARFEYNSGLFEDATITRLMGHFTRLLDAAVGEPGRPLSQLPILTDGERTCLLETWSGAGLHPPRPEPVHERILRSARENPDGTAVVHEGRRLSYGELAREAAGLGSHLTGLGCGPEERMGLYLERSVEMIVGLLGILLSGAAYVPLDPSLPARRRRFLIEDAGVETVVTSRELAHSVPADVSIVTLGVGGSERGGWPQAMSAVQTLPENLAYVIYTSGSTGRPRPVGVEHRALSSYVDAILERLEPRPRARFATVSTVAADLGNTMIFAALCTGGELHVVAEDKLTRPEALARDFAGARLGYLKIVPSHLAALLESSRADGLLPTEALILGGEATAVSWADELRRRAPGCRILNHYGPTETTIGVTTWEGGPGVLPPAVATLPLGRPLIGSRIHVLGDHLELQPPGALGELVVGGSNLSRGYIGRPAATARRFVPDPYDGPGRRLYRTGDAARRLVDGTLLFSGRRDDQVKVRGHRVEPREVEAVIESLDGIQRVIVRPQGNRKGTPKGLVAYCVPDRQRAPELGRALREERLIGGRSIHELPNTLRVVHQNHNETDYLYQEIFERQAYFKHGLSLDDGAVVFDVGANIGMFMLYVHRRWRGVRVYSFEPIPAIHDLLKTNAALHDVQGDQLNCGLSDTAGTTTFTFYPKFTIMSGLHADLDEEKDYVRSYMVNQREIEGLRQMEPLIRESERLLEDRLAVETLEVRLRTLSDVIDELGVERIDLLKVNVEKNEHRVLAGVRNEHWPRVRQVVAEVHDVDGRNEELTELLTRHGFEVAVEQDPLLGGTDLYYLYARRSDAVARDAAEAADEAAGQVDPRSAESDSLDGEQVTFWRSVFDDVYGRSGGGSDPTFDITGWTRRETGEPFSGEAMREWVDATVRRILDLEPRRVLEIGCGTGLLVHRVAPHCQEYLATDFSEAAIGAVERSLRERPGRLDMVRLERRAAHELEDLDLGSFDCVILNSVAQYFPGVGYLDELVAGLVGRLPDGAKVFLGDLHSLPLLEAAHVWSELVKAECSTPREELKRRVGRRIATEEEMLLDPAYFGSLRSRLDRLAGVDVLLKRGGHDNELNRFNYDIVLYVGPEGPDAPPSATWTWTDRAGTVEDLARALDRDRPPALLLEGIPNRRLGRVLRATAWLRDGLPPETVGELEAELGEEEPPGLDPDEVHELGAQLGYRAAVGWSLHGAGRFDALLVPEGRRNAAPGPELPIARPAAEHRLLSSFANDPLRERLARVLVPELRRRLRETLPDYMVPTEFILIEEIPRTTNGKVDLRALPEPAPPPAEEAGEQGEAEALQAQDFDLERSVAWIWSDLLGRDDVGMNDNFFDLGGHSLLVVEVSTRLMEAGLCSQELSVVDFFQYPTVRTLARFLRGDGVGEADDGDGAVVEETEARAVRRREALRRRKEAAARQEAP